ncbi:MAG: acyl carrier protein [Bacteroidaceae bacterium]|nr:acyl carrier protein [Bacteroidaceae bacterium]
MNNLEKYNEIFATVFGAKSTDLGADYCKENVPEWDSVHQLNIISEMEDAFDLMLDPEDIVACTSYEAGKDILRRNGVEI